MRCANISQTVCSTRAGSRPSRTQAATRCSSRILRSVRRNSSPPPSLVIQAPSNWATTRREKCSANSKFSWVHSVMRKAVLVRASSSSSTPQLCLKRRPFSTVNYACVFTTGEKSGLALMHSTENYSRHFGRIIEAWERQLPGLTCPLKFEDGRLFRRLVPERRGEAPNWEEDDGIQPEVRWLTIDEVIVNTQIEAETMLTIPALVFVGVVGVKHQCRPATDEELQRAETESPIKAPTGFMLGRQRFCELLVEVMGV